MGRIIAGIVSSGSLLATALMSGCAYLQPYIALDPLAGATPEAPAAAPAPTPPSAAAMPNVARAVRTLDAWQKIVEKKHDDLTTTTRVLNLATFGLAAGAAISPVYNAYKDLTTALGIGAAVTYTSNTLFFPGDQAGLYNAAQDAFGCVRGKGQRLLSAISPERSLQDFDDNFAALRAQVSACDAEPAFRQLQASFTAARDSLGRALDADYAAAEQMQEAGRNIAIAVNREIDNRAASPAAILAAAKSLSVFGVPAISPASVKPPTVAVPAAPRRAECTDADRARMATQTTAYGDKKRNVDKALDGIGQLDSACNLNPPAIPELTITQDSVTLVKSTSFNIVVRGGRAPYQPVWQGTDPAGNGIKADMIAPDMLQISASDKLAAAGTYTLELRDSSVSGQSKKIAVIAKLAP